MVIVLGAIVTGSISLVLEDLLPKLNSEDTIVFPRWILLGSSVLLVAFAVWLRYEVRSYAGTLFSVQVLDEGVADRADEGGTNPRLAADRRYMYLHSLHRWGTSSARSARTSSLSTSCATRSARPWRC